MPTNLWTAGEDLKCVQIVERRPLDDWSATQKFVPHNLFDNSAWPVPLQHMLEIGRLFVGALIAVVDAVEPHAVSESSVGSVDDSSV